MKLQDVIKLKVLNTYFCFDLITSSVETIKACWTGPQSGNACIDGVLNKCYFFSPKTETSFWLNEQNLGSYLLMI